jgi:uncharacterized protein (TIGR02145 family)
MKTQRFFFIVFLVGIISLSHSQTATIGTQIWMSKNLDVTTFRNGDTIWEAKTDEEWKKAGENKQPAWCYYDNDPKNGEKYGKLYNWYAVNDPRGLAPSGYHIASEEEWNTLANFIDSNAQQNFRWWGETVGIKMKNSNGWFVNDEGIDGNGTNETGFSGLPGGERILDMDFIGFKNIGELGSWWSSSDTDIPEWANMAWGFSLNANDNSLWKDDNDKGFGLSVRCLNNNTVPITNFDTIKILKSKCDQISKLAYSTVRIGSQEWMNKNLNVNTFCNGDTIPEVKTENEWNKAGKNKQPAWCHYDYNISNDTIYGKLYNWYAVNDPRGLAPNGFHIPTNDEFNKLIHFLDPDFEIGYDNKAGKKLKTVNGWDEYKGQNGNGTNESGFSGLPGGGCNFLSEFFWNQEIGLWWSSSEYNKFEAWCWLLYNESDSFQETYYQKNYGFSVRCIKD